MKKFLFVICVVVFILPASLFAQPTNEEVGETVAEILALYMTNLFTVALTGNTEKVQVNEIEDGAEMVFKDYDASALAENLGAMSGEKDGNLSFSFGKISGKVVLYGSIEDPTSFMINVRLTNSNVRTLFLKASDSKKGNELIVNGKKYTNLDKFFEGVDVFGN